MAVMAEIISKYARDLCNIVLEFAGMWVGGDRIAAWHIAKEREGMY